MNILTENGNRSTLYQLITKKNKESIRNFLAQHTKKDLLLANPQLDEPGFTSKYALALSHDSDTLALFLRWIGDLPPSYEGVKNLFQKMIASQELNSIKLVAKDIEHVYISRQKGYMGSLELASELTGAYSTEIFLYVLKHIDLDKYFESRSDTTPSKIMERILSNLNISQIHNPEVLHALMDNVLTRDTVGKFYRDRVLSTSTNRLVAGVVDLPEKVEILLRMHYLTVEDVRAIRENAHFAEHKIKYEEMLLNYELPTAGKKTVLKL